MSQQFDDAGFEKRPADDQLVEVVCRFDTERVDVEVIAVVTEQLRAARLRSKPSLSAVAIIASR